MENLMKNILPGASYISAASPLILQKVIQNIPGITSNNETINNVFSKKNQLPFVSLSFERNEPLKLFWFSQHIGMDRGIQDAIEAINGISSFPVHITLLGNCSTEIKKELTGLLVNSNHKLIFKPACAETELIREASLQHIGLALETPHTQNRNIALTNKIFIYLLAGNAILFSETDAQKKFIKEYTGTGNIYPLKDVNHFREILIYWYSNKESLEKYSKENYCLAKNTLNWENESRVFLKLIQKTCA